jgi:hypothetical protein
MMALRLAGSATAEDFADPHLSLLYWWAIEPHLEQPREFLVLSRYEDEFWQRPIVKDFLVERIARRMAAHDLDGSAKLGQETKEEFASVALILEELRKPLWPTVVRGIEQALDGRKFDATPSSLAIPLDRLLLAMSENDNLFRLRVRFNHGDALKEAHARLVDPKRPDADKVKGVIPGVDGAIPRCEVGHRTGSHSDCAPELQQSEGQRRTACYFPQP